MSDPIMGPELAVNLEQLRYLIFQGMKGEQGTAGAPGPQGNPGARGADGVSPEVSVTPIPGGNRVTVTDAEHPEGQNFDVLDGTVQSVNGKTGADVQLSAADVSALPADSPAVPTIEKTGNPVVFENVLASSSVTVRVPDASAPVDVSISNQNLFTGTVANLAYDSGVIVSASKYRAIYQRVSENCWYTISRKSVDTGRFRVCMTANEPVAGEPCRGNYTADSETSITVFVPEGWHYLLVYLSNSSQTVDPANYQIEVGEQATTYAAHEGVTKSVNAGETASAEAYAGTTVVWSDRPVSASVTTSFDDKIKSLGFSDSTYELSGNQLLGNVTIRAAKTVNFSDGTPPVLEWYLIQDIDQNYYMSKDLKTKKFLFHFSPPKSSVSNWSFGIDADNNVFAIIHASVLSNESNLTDSVRTVNPVYFLAAEGYSVMHELELGAGLKPCGWLGNYGWCVLPNKDIVFCEYTRPTVATANVWRISGDVTDAANWNVVWSHAIVDTYDTSGMKHCHCVQYDFYTDIVYFSTGDSDAGSWLYHSTDHGTTWSLTYGPNKKKCRMLTMVFTAEHVYWASDSYDAENHYFFTADRVNGVIDVANAAEIPLGRVNSQSCYGCAYLQSEDLIVMMDRNDTNSPDGENWKFILKGYDLKAQKIVTLGTVEPLYVHAGFRAEFVDWYPLGSAIDVGFDPGNSATGTSVNTLAVCGNQGGTAGNGSTRINNLVLHVYRKPDDTFSIRFQTRYF